MNTLIDDMRIQIHFKENSIPSIHAGRMTQESKSELLKAILECKPKKIGDVDALWSNQQGHPLTYNQAITEWEQNIKALFGENKEVD